MAKNIRLPIFIGIALASLTTSFAQTESPVRTPLPQATLPLPFAAPEAFKQPVFDRDEHLGKEVSFGDFEITLGRTKLSTVVRALGGELQFTPARVGFLCYSAPLMHKSAKGQQTEARQNIWLTLGNRGEISGVRLATIPEGSPVCPPLPLEYSTVKVSSVYINEPARELERNKELKPSSVAEDSNWSFCFSQKALNKAKSEVGMFGAEKEGGYISKIISVVETVKGSDS